MSSPIEKDLADLRALTLAFCTENQQFFASQIKDSCESANRIVRTFEQHAEALLTQIRNPPSELHLTPLANVSIVKGPKFTVNIEPSNQQAPRSLSSQGTDGESEPVHDAEAELPPEESEVNPKKGASSKAPAHPPVQQDKRSTVSSGSTVFHTPSSAQNECTRRLSMDLSEAAQQENTPVVQSKILTPDKNQTPQNQAPADDTIMHDDSDVDDASVHDHLSEHDKDSEPDAPSFIEEADQQEKLQKELDIAILEKSDVSSLPDVAHDVIQSKSNRSRGSDLLLESVSSKPLTSSAKRKISDVLIDTESSLHRDSEIGSNQDSSSDEDSPILKRRKNPRKERRISTTRSSWESSGSYSQHGKGTLKQVEETVSDDQEGKHMETNESDGDDEDEDYHDPEESENDEDGDDADVLVEDAKEEDNLAFVEEKNGGATHSGSNLSSQGDKRSKPFVETDNAGKSDEEEEHFETANDSMDYGTDENSESNGISLPSHASVKPHEVKRSESSCSERESIALSGSVANEGEENDDEEESSSSPSDEIGDSSAAEKSVRKNLSFAKNERTSDVQQGDCAIDGKEPRKKSVSFQVPATSFRVGKNGKIGADVISALQKIGSNSSASIPKKPSESQRTPSNVSRVQTSSMAGQPIKRTGFSQMTALKYSSNRSSLLAHTPGALPPLPPSSKTGSQASFRGEESVSSACPPPVKSSFDMPTNPHRSRSIVMANKENDANAENQAMDNFDSQGVKSPLPSKIPLLSKDSESNLDKRTLSAASPDAKKPYDSSGMTKLTLEEDGSRVFSVHTEGMQSRTLSVPDSVGPKSEARRKIESIRAERIAGQAKVASSSQPSNYEKLSFHSSRTGSDRSGMDVTNEGEGEEFPFKFMRSIEKGPTRSDKKDENHSLTLKATQEKRKQVEREERTENRVQSSVIIPQKPGIHDFDDDDDVIVLSTPIHRKGSQKAIEVIDLEATASKVQSHHTMEAKGAESGGLLNLVTSVTSFLPTASSLLGMTTQENREEEEEEEAKAAMKQKKLDDERREAEMQMRRDLERAAKKKDAEEKQRRVEANRRHRKEQEEIREEERKKKEERRLRKKQEEEEGRRRKKIEEDKKKGQRRKQVILQKRKMEKDREMEAKRQKREKYGFAQSKPVARPIGASSSSDLQGGNGWEQASSSGALPPLMNRTPRTNKRALDSAGPSSYVMTPAKETLHEESDEEEERRRGKPVPKWAERNKLMHSVKDQTDPDDLFSSGAMCNLSEVFGEPRKYRTRSSSGNWTQDRLTAQEQVAYKKISRDVDNS